MDLKIILINFSKLHKAIYRLNVNSYKNPKSLETQMGKLILMLIWNFKES